MRKGFLAAGIVATLLAVLFVFALMSAVKSGCPKGATCSINQLGDIVIVLFFAGGVILLILGFALPSDSERNSEPL